MNIIPKLQLFFVFLLVLNLFSCEKNNGKFECSGFIGKGGAAEYEMANKISDFLREQYKEFADPEIVRNTLKGKTFLRTPGCVPSYIFYEITEPQDIAIIEHIMYLALDIAAIDRIKLTFYAGQSSSCSGNACNHSNGKIIKRLLISRTSEK